jgi:hypothetical protein
MIISFFELQDCKRYQISILVDNVLRRNFFYLFLSEGSQNVNCGYTRDFSCKIKPVLPRKKGRQCMQQADTLLH